MAEGFPGYAKEDLKETTKDLPEQEFFFRWATHHLNHPLQVILRRKANIIEDIALYLLRSRIEEKEKEERDIRKVSTNQKYNLCQRFQ